MLLRYIDILDNTLFLDGFKNIKVDCKISTKRNNKMQIFTRKNKGFTLIELLVVIAIIGILASIVLVALGNTREKARDVRMVSDMNQIRSLGEIFRDNNETYVGLSADPSVVILAADIAAQGGTLSWSNLTVDAYCAEVLLNGGNYFCVDSTLRADNYPTNPICTGAVQTCE